jgi:hypothetical protein
LNETNGGASTEVRGEALLEFGGSLGPVINQMFVPWAKQGADELVTKIALTLQPDYQKPKRPFFIVAWLKAVWRFGQILLGRKEDEGR